MPLVKFSGIDDLNAADEIVGKLCLVLRSDVPEAEQASLVHDAVGREVIDERLGSIGFVQQTYELPANDVWRVDGGAYGEVMVPVIEDCVRSITRSGPIRVTLLPGLVDESKRPSTEEAQ